MVPIRRFLNAKMTFQELVKTHLDYSPENGQFRWKILPRNSLDPNKVGYLDKDGYRIIGLFRKRYKAHHLAFLIMTGRLPIDQIDHKDGQPDNNSWINLRESNSSQNQQNKRKSLFKTSPYFGVYFNRCYRGPNKFHAYINENGVQRLIGRYQTELEAHKAYCKAKEKSHLFQPQLREDCKTNLS